MNEAVRPTRQMILNGRRVGYTILESPTARKCRLRVSPAGVVVVLPHGADESRAVDSLRANASWVLEQLAFQDRMGTFRTAAPEQPADTMHLRGQTVRIEVSAELTRRRYALIEQAGQVVHVRIPEGKTVDANKALESWLRRQARQDILARVKARTRQMKVRPGRVYIMGQRTKWGNCSRLRNLSFNWQLVKAPPAVLDYLVVHELAHLLEPYHSTRFWLIVRSHCPRFQQHRDWLRENQVALGLSASAVLDHLGLK